jgi:hypothetical protein
MKFRACEQWVDLHLGQDMQMVLKSFIELGVHH